MAEFDRERDALIDLLVHSADTVVDMLERALRSLVQRDPALAEEVVGADDRVDASFAEVQDRVVQAMSLPVSGPADHRMLAALLQVNIHIERMGDYAVNVARAGLRTTEEPEDPELASQLTELGLLATDVARTAVGAFARRDVVAARQLSAMDDPVDRLNLGVFRRLVQLAHRDETHLRWATHMILVARHIERFGDHAVDIGEDTIYAVTGEVVELSSGIPPSVRDRE